MHVRHCPRRTGRTAVLLASYTLRMADLLQQAFDAARHEVEAAGRRMRRRDDDWEPMFVGVDSDGQEHLVEIPTEFMSDESRKDELAEERLPAFVIDQQLRAVALVTSVWMVLSTEDRPVDPRIRPSESPNRIEAVCVHVMSADSQMMRFAKIHRFGRSAPRLGSWQDMPEGGVSTGRFVEAIQDSLRLVAST
jgi:hypothetical protein